MKFLKIASELRKAIEEKKFSAGDKIPHTHELAITYKVSRMTAARAVQQLAREGLVRRVKSKGTFILDIQNKAGFAYGPDRRIGFAFEGNLSSLVDTRHLSQAFLGVDKTLKATGKSLVLLALESKSTEEFIREIEANQVGGVLLYACYDAVLYRHLRGRRTPVVMLDYIDYKLPVDQVTTDHLKAGALAFQQLRSLNHRKIIFFGNHWRSRGRNDPDHEYWWQAMQAEAKNSRFRNLKSCFIPFDPAPLMREKARDFVKQHADYTGYVCASTTYYELLRDVLENDSTLRTDPRDAVLFSDWQEDKFINGRKVFQCRWDSRAMGAKAAQTLVDIMGGGPHKPQIHYLPVEIR